MDQIEKALQKLNPKVRKQLEHVLELIRSGQLDGLDVLKLAGQTNLYRVRKGDLRIIFARTGRSIRLVTLERRTTTTYRKR